MVKAYLDWVLTETVINELGLKLGLVTADKQEQAVCFWQIALSNAATEYWVSLGGFPKEIKTKIRYLIICRYHNFVLWKYDNNK